MKKKILVVDDHPTMLTFMVDMLEKEGHEVVTAEDGFSALNIVTSFIPDITVSDFSQDAGPE
jgi:CheY-like chemotaxis protein